tara:strand:+ start:2039 stop:2371 length:333 start_codon:yes stop_codon:yes gene_type:complete
MTKKQIEGCKNIIKNCLLNLGYELETYNSNILIFNKHHKKIDGASFCIIMTISKYLPNIQLSSCYTFGSFGFSTRKKVYSWSKNDIIFLSDIKNSITIEYCKYLKNLKNH